MRALALVLIVAALAAGSVVDSSRGTAAPARATAAADVFQGLGTWIDVYDTALYRTPNVVASRLAARKVATAWIEAPARLRVVDLDDSISAPPTARYRRPKTHSRGSRFPVFRTLWAWDSSSRS